MGRILAIDYGRVRVGLALSDERKKIALPFKMVVIPKKAKNVAFLVFEATKEIKNLEQIIVGNPLLLSGQVGEMAEEVKVFVQHLQELTSLPILLWDERLTSKMAERSLKEMGFSRKNRTDKCDPTAATLLLQSYLDSLPAAS